MVAHVTQLQEAQQTKKAEEEVIAIAEKELVASVQAEAFAKFMDNTIMHWVIIDLTITGVMDETSEASNATMIDEVESYIQDPTSKQSTTSKEATSRDKGNREVVIVYSTSSGPTPLNYAQPPTTVTRDQVQDMIGQAIESFVEC